MEDFKFSIPLTVRASDLNYGGHVGYQNFFAFFQEARLAYLNQFGFSELDIDGYGMIVAEANCKYKQELHLNQPIRIGCRVDKLKSKLFVMNYKIESTENICAEGFTKNLCFDYKVKKIVKLPAVFIQAVEEYEGESSNI